jgi:hypothetical protein
MIGLGQSLKIDSLLETGLIFLIVLSVVSIISFYVSINKTITSRLFTKGGYLTLTLPIGTHTILLSKILVNLVYMFFYFVAIFIGVFVILAGFGVFEELMELLSSVDYNAVFTAEEFGILLLQMFISLLSFVSFLTLVLFYNAFIHSGIIKTEKKGIRFLIIVIGLTIITNILSINIIPYCWVYDNFDGIYKVISVNDYNYQTLIIDFSSLLWTILGGVGCYLGSYFLIKNKKQELTA